MTHITHIVYHIHNSNNNIAQRVFDCHICTQRKGPLHIYGHIRARTGTTATSNESIMTPKPDGMLMPTHYTFLRNIGVLFG